MSPFMSRVRRRLLEAMGGLMVLMATAAHAGSVTYVYTDPQGTPLAEADASGNITATYDYAPYGSQALGSPPNGPGYTGHVNDPDTGLVYMQARYYDPAVGRFLSTDPVGPSVGNPFNFNRFAYANNSPIDNMDPDGRFSSCGGSYCTYRGSSLGSSSACEQTCVNPNSSKRRSGGKPKNKNTLSQKGLEFIEKHEGYRDKTYKDTAGNPTIGYGHLIKSGEDFSKGTTKTKAGDLLSQDTGTAVNIVNSKVTVKLSQTQSDALVDFTYNEGSGNFGKSALLKNINTGSSVTKENFTDWNQAGGKVDKGLTTRRTDEYNLYSSGTYGEP